MAPAIPNHMENHRGYTLVELLIIITIIGILVSFGLSAFTQAGIRQSKEQAKELIVTILQNAQKAAYVGDKDCAGSLDAVRVTFAGSAITTQAVCAGGVLGAPAVTDIPNVTFTTNPEINFKPLGQGVTFASGNSAAVNYTVAGDLYQVTVTSPGTIQYVGAI